MAGKLARKMGLRFLKAFARDVSIRHHWVQARRVTLNSFKHKGYWWHGRRREEVTMRSVERLLSPGQCVVELGAHIGYLTIYFSDLVGSTGRVITFEPSEQNLRYLRINMDGISNVTVEPVAVSDFIGEADFFVEDLTGQNNSLVESYHVLEINEKNAGQHANVVRENVPVTTLDAYCEARDVAPHFIKIDVEGAEEAALRGAIATLQKHQPIVLVEITRGYRAIYDLMEGLGYECLDDSLNPIEFIIEGTPNYFWIPAGRLRDGYFS